MCKGMHTHRHTHRYLQTSRHWFNLRSGFFGHGAEGVMKDRSNKRETDRWERQAETGEWNRTRQPGGESVWEEFVGRYLQIFNGGLAYKFSVCVCVEQSVLQLLPSSSHLPPHFFTSVFILTVRHSSDQILKLQPDEVDGHGPQMMKPNDFSSVFLLDRHKHSFPPHDKWT